MGKTSAFKNLLYALGRLPGLGFLRGAAYSVGNAERTAKNVSNAKKAVGDMKKEVKKEDKPAEEAPAEEKKEDKPAEDGKAEEKKE